MRFMHPVPGRVTSPFGTRVNPFDKSKKQFHPGLDYSAPEGTPVCCACDGVVERAYFSSPNDLAHSYGLCVIVRHDATLQTRYAHLSAMSVKAGDKVKQGDVLGLSGNTGASKGAHLHFEVICKGTPIDPVAVIKQGEGK